MKNSFSAALIICSGVPPLAETRMMPLPLWPYTIVLSAPQLKAPKESTSAKVTAGPPLMAIFFNWLFAADKYPTPRLFRRHIRSRAEDDALLCGESLSVARERGRVRQVHSAWSPANAFASPKSSTFTLPSGVTLMLAGLRSRWMTPFSCAASSASAIWSASFRASSTGIGPPLYDRPASPLPPVPEQGSSFRRIPPARK